MNVFQEFAAQSGNITAFSELPPLKVPRMETIKRTAEIFGLPVHFVRQKVLSGEIVAVRAGRKFLVNVESVSEFLSTGVPQGTVAASRSSDKENAPRVTPIPFR